MSGGLAAFLTLLGLCAGISLIGLGVYLLCIRVFHFGVEIALWVFIFVVLFLFGLALKAGVI